MYSHWRKTTVFSTQSRIMDDSSFRVLTAALTKSACLGSLSIPELNAVKCHSFSVKLKHSCYTFHDSITTLFIILHTVKRAKFHLSSSSIKGVRLYHWYSRTGPCTRLVVLINVSDGTFVSFYRV